MAARRRSRWMAVLNRWSRLSRPPAVGSRSNAWWCGSGGLALVLLFGCLIAGAVARDIYVDNVYGDDRRDGTAAVGSGDRAGPCRTIARGLRIVQQGDRLVLANHGTPYRESLTLQAARNSGLPGEPFELQGNNAVLDGTQPVPGDAWEHYREEIFRFQPPRMGHLVLYLNAKPAIRSPAAGYEGLASVKPLEWSFIQGQVFFRVEKDRLPREYELAYTALPVGLTLYDVRHVVVSNLIVQGFQLDGVNAHDNVFDTSLIGLTCRGNGRSGISIGGASRVRLESCLVGDNGAAQVRTEGFSRTEIADSQLLENTAPAIVREGGLVTRRP